MTRLCKIYKQCEYIREIRDNGENLDTVSPIVDTWDGKFTSDLIELLTTPFDEVPVDAYEVS